MSWVTPMGLPVVQPYRRHKTVTVQTSMQFMSLVDVNDATPVSVARQRSAFPPNYVHSLDSTHMLMTAVDCHGMGLAFAAVHDSYWTHASSVEAMSASLRRQFVALHSQPLLGEVSPSVRMCLRLALLTAPVQLRSQLQLRFPHVEFPPLPELGSFDLQRVMESPYFFS